MKIYTALSMPSVKAVNAARKRYRAASFFAGGGGASFGYRMAGFDVVYANEFVKVAAETYRANAPSTTYVDETDIRKVSAARVMQLGKFRVGELDLLDGSPPCSSFSSSTVHRKEKNYGRAAKHVGTGSVEQRIDDLFFEFTRILRALQPKTFVAENVPGLLTSINRGQFLQIMEALKRCGYEVAASVVDPSMLGVPQRRKRLLFIGVRRDLAKRGFKPVLPRTVTPSLTVEDVLPHVRRIRVSGGGAWSGSGNDLRMTRGRGYVRSNVPSPTITALDASATEQALLSSGGWVELADGTRRKYTISELKRVFGYPADYRFTGTPSQQWERMGLSHVPLSTYYVGATLAEQVLDKIRKP